METKKNKKVDLESRRIFHFTIGLVLSVSVVFVAFEWKHPEGTVIVFEPVEQDFPKMKDMEITDIKPPKPKKLPKVVEVPNEEEPDVDLEFTFHVDINDPVDELVEIEEPEPDENTDIHLVVEEQPSFPGGLNAFYEYVGKHMKYPRQAIKQGREGKVFVQFVINKDGSLTNIQVIKGIGGGCDEEAIRVLKEAPLWNPGKQRGKPVRVRMVLPITFQLQ